MSTISSEEIDAFNEAVATFGDRLAAAREAKGLTVEGLAEKLGVDLETVGIWENDADVPRATVCKCWQVC